MQGSPADSSENPLLSRLKDEIFKSVTEPNIKQTDLDRVTNDIVEQNDLVNAKLMRDMKKGIYYPYSKELEEEFLEKTKNMTLR